MWAKLVFDRFSPPRSNAMKKNWAANISLCFKALFPGPESKDRTPISRPIKTRSQWRGKLCNSLQISNPKNFSRGLGDWYLFYAFQTNISPLRSKYCGKWIFFPYSQSRLRNFRGQLPFCRYSPSRNYASINARRLKLSGLVKPFLLYQNCETERRYA